MSKILVDTIDTRSGTTTLTVGSSNSTAISLAKNVSLASSVVQSNFNNPSFLAYPSGGSSGGSISNLTETTVTLNTEVFDTDGKFDTSTYRFTPGIAGKYFIYASGRVQSDADFDPFQVSIYKNDSSELARSQDRHEHYTIGFTSVVADLNTTDYITLKMYQGSGGTLQISGFQNVTFMGGFRIGT